MKMALTYKNCCRRNTIFTKPFSLTWHPPPSVFSNIRGTLQWELHQMQNSWLSKKADEIEFYADHNDMNNVYSSLKTVYSLTMSGSSPLLSAHGNSLTIDKEMILEHLTEHFHSVLNQPYIFSDDANSYLPQVPINNPLAEFPSQADVENVQWKSSCLRLHSRCVCSCCPQLIWKITGLFQSLCNQEEIPQGF